MTLRRKIKATKVMPALETCPLVYQIFTTNEGPTDLSQVPELQDLLANWHSLQEAFCFFKENLPVL